MISELHRAVLPERCFAIAGLLLVVAVLTLAPAVYFSSMIWWVVATTFAVMGLVLFYSARRVRRDLDRRSSSDSHFDGYSPGPLSPGRWRRVDSDSDGADGGTDGD